MKNQFLFLFLLISITACNKSEELTMTFQEQVIGEWQINSFVINSCTDPGRNIPITFANEEGCLDVMGDTNCTSIIFSENGQVSIRIEESDQPIEIEILKYQLDESNNTVNICEDQDDCTTFSLQNGSLYNEMDEDGCICIFEFKKM